MSYSPVGFEKSVLDTPALLVDLDQMERNIARIASRCRECGVDWRPHTKGNKIPAIAHKLVSAGAVGITCAKLGEAEVMAAAGIQDILVANQIVGDQKIARLVNLQRHASVMVAVDHPHHIGAISEAARDLGAKVRVLVEIDVGMQRCGVEPGKPALELAQQAEAAPGVIFAGIMGYEGHAMDLPDEEKEAACARSMDLLAQTAIHIQASGLEVGIVSAGGTGTLAFTPALPGVTEIQAGGGILMDTFYPNDLGVKGLEQALTILATVVSHPAADRAVIDAGRKTTSAQFRLPEVTGREGVTVQALSAEHGTLSLDGPGTSLKIGEKIELISGYSDMTVFLHDRLYGTRNNRIEVVWDILGRGKLQ